MNAGLLRDRRMVYALDHNPHTNVLILIAPLEMECIMALPELSGCITTLTVRNTGGCKRLCSNGHLDRSRWQYSDVHYQFLSLVLLHSTLKFLCFTWGSASLARCRNNPGEPGST